jgi:hypothetical protein
MEWISVEDRLPEVCQLVRVMGPGVDGADFCFSHDPTKSRWDCHWNDEVTHWMPIEDTIL